MMNTSQIPARIRKARERLGMSQSELARACDMAPARICDAEHGRGSLKIETLQRIAAALGVKMNYFWRVDNRQGRA